MNDQDLEKQLNRLIDAQQSPNFASEKMLNLLIEEWDRRAEEREAQNGQAQ